MRTYRWKREHSFVKRKIQRTLWYHSSAHRDLFGYEVQCINDKLDKQDYLEGTTNSVPVLYLDNKAMVVGTIERQISSIAKTVAEHRTSVQLTATHTSGTKNFTVFTKCRIGGGANVVSHSQSVVLKPGQKKRIRLYVPAGGSWATIDSITVHENRPTNPIPSPTPPGVVPVPVPVPSPPPAHRPRC